MDLVQFTLLLLAFGIVAPMAFAKVWWSRAHFIHEMTVYGGYTQAEAESDWDAIVTLCENHDTCRMRWRWLEDYTDKILEIRFQVTL